jgi:hypothetical protein
MTKQESLTGYKFTILSEDVATQDLFEDQTHERVSENLYQIIRGASKGVTIGLEGSWGSGKSTVIKLLKDKLTKNNEEKNLFFMFDAWAHDGDPLRRIFLESLIREIDPKEEEQDLNKIKGKIIGRKKVVEIKAKKSTSRLGKFISLSALLIPLGSAFLGKVKYDLFVWPWSNEAQTPYFLFLVGLLFCLSPLLVLAYWCRWGDKNPDTKKISWEFFSVDSQEDYTQDITEDGERTSIEFEDHFKTIIQTAMNKGLIDKCIVVVDNLDRVDPDHAKNIWSTLQTFFQKRSNGDSGGSWSDKLWFVIPFDRDGFHKIWKANDNDRETGKSFLKKCFQLIAEVPHPVMSGWSRYAEACINEALNQWPDHERKSVLSTYVRYASRLDKSPTPRDIKVFANQVGLLGAMWGGQASVEAICLYTLFKESFTTNELRGHLVAGQLPQTYQTDADRSDICAELAGLLFGVNKQKGLQLLLGPEIKSAFNLGDGKILSTLLEDHGSAFWIAYEHSKSEWMIGGGHTDEYKISFTKAFHEGLSTHKNRIHRDIQQLTRAWINSLDSLNFSNFDYSASLGLIVELSSERKIFIDSLHNSMSNKIETIISTIDTDKFPESSLSNIKKTTDLLAEVNKPLAPLPYNKLTSVSWKVWLNHLKKSETSLPFVLPKTETISFLAGDVDFTSPNLNAEALEILVKTYDIYPSSSEWESVVDQVVAWMNLRSRSHACEPLYGLAVKIATYANWKIASKIKLCLKGAPFWVSGQHSSCAENPSLPILAAITLEDELQEIGHVSTEVKSFWSETADQDQLTEIFNQLKQLNKLNVIWELCRDRRNSSAVNIIKNNDDKSLYSSWAGANYIDGYEWASDEEIRSIAEKLALNDSFFNNDSSMIDDPITYQNVYKIFYSLGDTKICSFIDAEISKIKKEDWLNCISENGEALYLVKNKNPHFSDALKEFLVDVVSGANKAKENSDLMRNIPSLLAKAADLNTAIIPAVLDAYFTASKDYLKDYEFELLCLFFEPHVLVVDESLLMNRINFWIDSDSKERIRWIVKQNVKPFKEPLESLMSRVELGLKSGDVTQNDLATLVNTKFNLGVVAQVSENKKGEQDTLVSKEV